MYSSVDSLNFVGKIINNKLFYESDYSSKISILNLADGKQASLEIPITGTSQWDIDGKYIVYSNRSNDEAEIFIEPISHNIFKKTANIKLDERGFLWKSYLLKDSILPPELKYGIF